MDMSKKYIYIVKLEIIIINFQFISNFKNYITIEMTLG